MRNITKARFRPLKRWLNRNKEEFPAFIVLVSFTSIWLFGHYQPVDADHFNSINEVITAAIIALLGVAVTSFIFLHQELQERKKDRPFMKRTVDKLLERNRKSLVLNCLLGLSSLVCCIIVHETYFYQKYPKTVWSILLLIAYLSIIGLVSFNVFIINHRRALGDEALEQIEQLKFQRQHVKFEPVKDSSFLKDVNDIQQIIDRIILAHSVQVEGVPDKWNLRTILSAKTNGQPGTIPDDYDWLLNYRDFLLVAHEFCSERRLEKENLLAPVDFPMFLQSELMACCLHGEMLTDCSISDKSFKNGDFEKTSFNSSLLVRVAFTDCRMAHASFENGQLMDVVFPKKNTDGLNFRRAVLQLKDSNGCSFKFCNFTESDFSRQDSLTDVSFESSNFTRANFIGEVGALQMQNVSFASAVCESAKFSSANCISVTFKNANLAGAEFSSATLTECNFRHAALERATLFYSILKTLDLAGTRLERTSFFYSLIQGCNFEGAYGSDANFRKSVIEAKSNFNYSVLASADFSDATIRGESTFIGATFSRAFFNRTSADHTSFNNAIFIGAQFLDEQAQTTRLFQFCDFSGAIFDQAILADVQFHHCNFSNCSFSGTKLRNVVFCNCKIAADFRDADIDDKTCQQLHITSCPDNHLDAVESIIRFRRSTRKFQDNQTIPREIIDKLIDAARMAPSPKNSQPWFFYKLDDKQKIIEVAEALREKSEEIMIEITASAISSASVILFVCKSTNTLPLLSSVQSIGAAIENLVLQATALGIDSLWVCDVLDAHDEIKQVLGLEYDFISAILLGKSEFSSGANRKSIEEISSWL